MFGHYFHYN